MIAVRDVTVHAGAATLVDSVSLDVVAGEVMVLVGPNGAGKSTLLSVMSGDRTPDGGQVTVQGGSLHAMTALERARIRAVLPQASTLSAAFTALEVVMLGQVDGRGHDRLRRVRALRRLASVELAGLAGRGYPTLSGGEKQRVQLARILEQLGDDGGRALLLDEPTAALDPRHQHLVMARARAAAACGHAVVVVLHDLSLASRWADRIALLDRGALVVCGSPAEVLRRETLRRVFAVDFTMVPDPAGRGLLLAPSQPDALEVP